MRKEVTDVVHQPRLLLTLVLGPFLIMAAFGLGYRDSPPPLRTMLVAPANSPMLKQVDTFAGQLQSYADVVGVGSDPADAMRRLRDGTIDVIVSFPADPLSDVLAGKQAPITIVHTRLDPIERTAISFASSLAVDQINGAILAKIIGSGQQATEAPVGEVLGRADAAAKHLSAAYTSGDATEVTNALAELDATNATLAISAQKTSVLLSEFSADNTSLDRSQRLLGDIKEMTASLNRLDQPGTAAPDPQTVARLSTILSTIRRDFDQFVVTDPNVVAQPFAPDVQLAVPGVHRVTDWYAPAAVILILQQFGLAFGSLTFVRERQLGITDVFRVAPVNAGSALTGKYLAYLIVGGGIGAVLTSLVIWVLHIPITGSVAAAAAVMGLTLFASIGLGFVISLMSASDAQAVQYALMLLLASLFFSGFFLSVGQMKGPAQLVTWVLPVSYGMQMLRDVMLRGTNPQTHILVGLAIYGTVMFALAMFGTRRRMSATTA